MRHSKSGHKWYRLFFGLPFLIYLKNDCSNQSKGESQAQLISNPDLLGAFCHLAEGASDRSDILRHVVRGVANFTLYGMKTIVVFMTTKLFVLLSDRAQQRKARANSSSIAYQAWTFQRPGDPASYRSCDRQSAGQWYLMGSESAGF